jgi:hypothetical protein
LLLSIQAQCVIKEKNTRTIGAFAGFNFTGEGSAGLEFPN